MYSNHKGARRLNTKSVIISLMAMIALVMQFVVIRPVEPVQATGCQSFNVYSMGYWKTHESEWVLPQTLGNQVVSTEAEANYVFDHYADSPTSKVMGQLLALKFSIAAGAGLGFVPGDTITLNQLASLADTLLQQVPPASEGDLLLMANRLEAVNTAGTVSNCLNDKGILIVKKKVTNDDGGQLQPSDFTMTVTAVNPSMTSFPGNSSGTTVIVNPGNYNVDEVDVQGYTKSRTSSCTGSISAGQTKYCTVTNNDNPTNFCELEITKTVDKVIAVPGDVLTYTLSFENVGSATCTGGGVKVQDTVDPRLQYLSETHSGNVSAGYGAYPVYQNSILRWNAHDLTPGESGQITWTAKIKPISVCGLFDIPNTAQITSAELNWQWVLSNTVHTVGNIMCPATLIVKKHVINDDGGNKQASDFTMQVSAQSPSQTSFPGSEDGVSVTVNPGNYNVSEIIDVGYAVTRSVDCEGTIAANQTKICTITNNDNPAVFCRLELIKEVDKSTASPGEILTYTLTIKNTGTGYCTGGGVRIEDSVDSVLEFLDESHTPSSLGNSWGISAGYGCPPGNDPCVGGEPLFDGNKLLWSGHEMAPGAQGVITWRGRIRQVSSCKEYEISNTFIATANELFGQWVTSNTVNTMVQPLCQISLQKINTCSGSGELYLYKGSQFQNINTTFQVQRDSLLIFTRGSYLTSLSVKLNDVPTTPVLVKNVSTPFSVKVYEVQTEPGDVVEVNGTTNPTNYGARAIQGYLAQDQSAPAYDVSTLEVIFDDAQTNDMYLLPGTYSYVFFDKYSLNNNGTDDSRQLNVNLNGPSGNLVDQNYIKPAPAGTEGAVVGSFTVSVGGQGTHTLSVTTEDSIYWPKSVCEVPKAKLIVKKHVVNDNGGQLEADDFTMQVTAQNPSHSSFPGDETGVEVIVEPGDYNVTEVQVDGYAMSRSSDCEGTIDKNQVKICTITNDDDSTIFCELELIKTVDKQVAEPGDTLTYYLRLENVGTGLCTGGGVKVQDMVDARLTYISETHTPNITGGYGAYPVFDGSMLRWNAHELTPGEVGEISWQATINDITSCGIFDIPNTARASAQELNWQWVLSNTVHTVGEIICRANLIVKKIVLNDNGGTKQPHDFTMQVTGNNPSPASFPGSATGTNVVLEPGDYSVSETQDPGYAMSLSNDCVGTIAHGETKTCTVTNDDIPLEDGKLIVKKHVINDNNGTKVAADFSLNVTAAGNFQTIIPGNENGTEFSVEPGGYLVVENDSLGYSVSYDNCQGTIAAGETQTCTVTNDDLVPPPPDPAYIVVIKHVVNDDNGPNKQASDFTMHLEAGNGAFNNYFPGAETPGVQTQVPVGYFTVSETVDPDYTMTTSGDCTGSIAAGETKTCTIINNDIPPPPPPKGKLVIIKKVINDNGWLKQPHDFSILVQVGNNFQQIIAGADTPGAMLNVDPGDYTITEIDSLGYTMTTSGDCTGTVAAQEIKTCTITNDDPAKGTLMVIKHVINDSGTGSKTAGDFTMSVAAQNPSQTSFAGKEAPGVTITVDPGDYNVDEIDSFNYTKSRSTDCTGSIAAGETKTCTITNNDPSGGGGCVGPSCGGGGGGCTGASCNPNPSPVNASITCGPNATLSFTYGADVTGITLADNLSFNNATSISPVASLPWSVPAGDGYTVYVKFQRNTGSIEIRQATTNNCTPPGEVLSCTNLVTAETELVVSPNQVVINSAKGNILSQHEAQGQLWYVHYSDGLKYHIPGAPQTMEVVKLFAGGITNQNLFRIQLGLSQNIGGTDTDDDNLADAYEEAMGTSAIAADTDSDGFTDYVEVQNGYDPLGSGKPATLDDNFAKQQAGRFFVQVEGAGQVWYVNPTDHKRYYIPSDATHAYNVIAGLAQNMGNADIRQIPVGQEIGGVDTSAFAGCYVPSPTVLGAATELPRTGFPFDLAQLVILPSLAAYPWLKRRYSTALTNYFSKLKA